MKMNTGGGRAEDKAYLGEVYALGRNNHKAKLPVAHVNEMQNQKQKIIVVSF